MIRKEINTLEKWIGIRPEAGEVKLMEKLKREIEMGRCRWR